MTPLDKRHKLSYHRIGAVLLQRRGKSHVPDRHINYFVQHFYARRRQQCCDSSLVWIPLLLEMTCRG